MTSKATPETGATNMSAIAYSVFCNCKGTALDGTDRCTRCGTQWKVNGDANSPVATFHAEEGSPEWRETCEAAYTVLRELRTDVYDEITPVEPQGRGEWRTYLHRETGENFYVSIQTGA